VASSRIVNVNFWKDSYIIELNPQEKLLFIYFLTNPRTTLAGIYEISIREVAFDTDLDKQFIEATLEKFTNDGRMYFERNWLVLTNFIKHQRLNPSIKKGIQKAIDELPDWLQSKIQLSTDKEDNQMTIFLLENEQSDHSLSTVTPQLNIIKSNIKKLKEKKSKHEADKPQDSSKELSAAQKKSYAIAMEKEREQETRVKALRSRTPSKLAPVAAVDPYAFREGKK